MVAFTKVNGFVENLAEKVFNLGSDTLTVALSNTAPASETNNPTTTTANAKLSNVTQVAYTNLSSRVLTVTASAQSGGTYSLDVADLVLTASGAVAAFRYLYIYDDTATNDELIGYYDYGSSVTLANGETFTLDLTTTLLTIA